MTVPAMKFRVVTYPQVLPCVSVSGFLQLKELENKACAEGASPIENIFFMLLNISFTM